MLADLLENVCSLLGMVH